MRVNQLATLILAIGLVAAVGSRAWAVPYASGVRNTGGSMYEFVLNESADNVTIMRNGGNALNLGALAAGRHTFDLTGFTSFDIQASKSAAPGLTRISDPTNLYTKFFRPSGLAINTNPSSPYFGTVYVANGSPGTTAGANTRPTGDGIYSLTADMLAVDLSTPGWTVPSATDTTQYKTGTGWGVGSNEFGSGTNSPFRITLDDGGNVIVGDWSDANGGIKYIGPNLTGGGLVLSGQDGHSDFGYLDPNAPLDGSVSPFVHGSIRGVPNATGTVGVDLVVRAMDEDLNRDPIGIVTGAIDPAATDDGNHVWKWNVGAETNSVVKPQLLIDVGNGEPVLGDYNRNGTVDAADYTVWRDAFAAGAETLPRRDPTATGPVGQSDYNFWKAHFGDTDTSGQLGSDSAGRPYMLDLNIGVRADAEFFPQLGDHGLWILTQPRFNGDESGIVFVDVDDTGATPPKVVWSSRQFTIDSGLDGFPNDPDDPPAQDPNSDIFRNTGTVDVSLDGKMLYIHRWLTDDPDNTTLPDVNPYLGRDSEHPGRLLAVPLDENGIPDILVDSNGTPGDPLDDILTNIQSIITAHNNTFRAENHEVEVDAAGNIYITDNSSELLEVFSPGGNTMTTFSFDGVNYSFTVGSLGSGAAFLAHGAVPEPATGLLIVLAAGSVLTMRRRMA